MTSKGYMWVALGWLTLIVCHTVMQGSMAEKPDLLIVLSMRVVTFKQWLGIPLPWPNIEWIESAWNLATWNFSFFQGNLQWLRAFPGFPLMAYLSWGFYSNILPTLITGVSALVNFLANIVTALNPFRFLRLG